MKFIAFTGAKLAIEGNGKKSIHQLKIRLEIEKKMLSYAKTGWRILRFSGSCFYQYETESERSLLDFLPLFI